MGCNVMLGGMLCDVIRLGWAGAPRGFTQIFEGSITMPRG